MRSAQFVYMALAFVAVSSGSVGRLSPSSSMPLHDSLTCGIPAAWSALFVLPGRIPRPQAQRALTVQPGSRDPGGLFAASQGRCARSTTLCRVSPPMPSSMRQARLLNGGLPQGVFPEVSDASAHTVHRHFGLRSCGASTHDTASSGNVAEKKPKARDLSELEVDDLHAQLENLIDAQWARAAAECGLAPMPVDASSNATYAKVKHVVGGFSVVVRMPDQGIAYRMQPMRSVKAGLTWVAFYMMLHEAVLDRKASAEAASADVLYRPDRSVILGSPKLRNSTPRKMAWEHLQVAQEFQSERLRQATRRLVYFRHHLLKTANTAYRQGLCTSAQNCPISWADGGKLEGPCVSNGLMFPSHWFWIKVGDPADVAEPDESIDEDAQDAAHESGGVEDGAIAGGGSRRMKGSELAAALLFRQVKVPSQHLQRRTTSGGPRIENGTRVLGARSMTAPAAVNVAPVKVLASVFPHAQGDVGGLCKRLWMMGAADNVTILVLQSVLRGLRRLHSVGVPHGDLKAANVLYVDGVFCLTDMPALNWSATPVLTKDPVAHTLVQGKRLLCNDMWGLGLITLSLVVGYTEMEAIKSSLRKLEPRVFNASPGASRKMDAVTQNWLVVSLMFLHFLGRAGTPVALESAGAATKALSSSWLRRHVPAVSSKAYLESCQKAAQTLAYAVLAPARSAAVIESLAYCLDVTDLARNSHGIPWPTDAAEAELVSVSQ